MKVLRVVHVVPALFGYEGVYGGAERYALELARAMADRVPTRLVAFGARPMTRRDGNLRVVVVRNWVPYRRLVFDPIGPGLFPHLAWANVVHYHQTQTLMAGVAALAGRLTGRPVFSTHHGGSGFGLHRLTDTTRWYAGQLHVSGFSRKAYGHEGLPGAGVIGGGVDTDRFRPPAEPPARDFVLYAGRFLPHKGINDLLEAAPPDLPVVLAGRPWKHARGFYALLRRLADGKAVRFAEDCTDAEMTRLYQQARCVVLPSVHRPVTGGYVALPELLGQTLLEGMACGTAAICTAVGGMPEVVEDGVSGFVVPPNDPAALREKLLWLRDRPAEVERMGRAARDRAVRLFSWPAVVDRCLEYYRGAAGDAPRDS